MSDPASPESTGPSCVSFRRKPLIPGGAERGVALCFPVVKHCTTAQPSDNRRRGLLATLGATLQVGDGGRRSMALSIDPGVPLGVTRVDGCRRMCHLTSGIPPHKTPVNTGLTSVYWHEWDTQTQPGHFQDIDSCPSNTVTPGCFADRNPRCPHHHHRCHRGAGGKPGNDPARYRDRAPRRRRASVLGGQQHHSRFRDCARYAGLARRAR